MVPKLQVEAEVGKAKEHRLFLFHEGRITQSEDAPLLRDDLFPPVLVLTCLLFQEVMVTADDRFFLHILTRT